MVDIVSSPTSIDPNPDVIEPALRAPTVTIVLAPNLLAYVVPANVESNLSSN